VRISQKKLKSLCKSKGLNTTTLLHRAHVSKTAYYALARKEDLLPRSVRAIANALGVYPSSFMEEADAEAVRMHRLLKSVDALVRENPGLDRDNVRHTLLMLSMKPIDRLRRSLIRGRKIDIH